MHNIRVNVINKCMNNCGKPTKHKAGASAVLWRSTQRTVNSQLNFFKLTSFVRYVMVIINEERIVLTSCGNGKIHRI